MLLVKKNTFFALVLALLHLPIFFINNSWDGSIIDYGFSIQDLSGIKIWYWESSSNFQFIIINFLFIIKNLLNFSNELIFDLFTIIFLVLFCYEIQKYAQRVFGLDTHSSQACFAFALIYPVWNSLTEINLGLYLFCFYLAILGYRLFINKKFIINFLGIILMLCSFSIKSNFAFVLALPLIEFVHFFFQKKSIKYYVLAQIASLCVISYLINSFYFPPYGSYAGYNQIQLNNLNFIEIVKNLNDYFSFLFYFSFIPAIFFIYLKFSYKSKTTIFDSKTNFSFLVLFIFFLITLAPYILVQKSIDIFNFSNFDSRHAYLTVVPVSIFLAIIVKKISEKISFKAAILLKYLIIFQSLLILSLSYFVKYNSTLVDNNLIKTFQNLDEPRSGYIILYGDKLSRSYYHLNNLLYKSYNKAAWLVEINKKDKLKDINKEDFIKENSTEILSKEAYPIKHAMNDQSDKCLTLYEFVNEINNKELITKLYLFNQKKYFILKKINEDC